MVNASLFQTLANHIIVIVASKFCANSATEVILISVGFGKPTYIHSTLRRLWRANLLKFNSFVGTGELTYIMNSATVAFDRGASDDFLALDSCL